MECIIRPWSLADAADLAAAANNKKIHDNLRDGLPYPYTVQDARSYIVAMHDAPPDKVYAWAIALGDRAIGSIGIFRKDNIHSRTAELGYYIAEAYWGNGFCASAVKQACEFIFDKTDIVRIFAEPFAHNLASCRVLEKNGFTLEGILKKNAIKNAEILDMRLYALVRESSNSL